MKGSNSTTTSLSSRFHFLPCNYPHILHYVGFMLLLYPALLWCMDVGENLTTPTLTWNYQDIEENGHLIHFNASIVSTSSCSDEDWNVNCVNATNTQNNGGTSVSENEDGSGGLQSAVDFGIHLSLKECQLRFRWSRWNCSEKYWHANTGTRENAYVTAINAAAVTYSIAKACARGDISNCGCAPPTTISSGRGSNSRDDPAQHPNPHPQGGYWRWGGCSADVDFAVKLARKSTPHLAKRVKVDGRRKSHKNGGRVKTTTTSAEIDRDLLQAVSTHNKRVGRNMVQKSLDTECKCHGVSGSCTLKTCWMKLPQFAKIGRIVFNLYKGSSLVNHSDTWKQRTRERGASVANTNSSVPAKRRIFLQLFRDAHTGDKPSRTQLVHLIASPTYCDHEGGLLHPGTRGRRCLRSQPIVTTGEEASVMSLASSSIEDNEEGSCSILCCGRGYNTHVTWRRWKCRCIFKWCCTVECEDCEERMQIYTCN